MALVFSERKLERIRKARGQTSKDLLKSLEERRQDAIARLLTENHAGAPSETEEYADENVPTKWLKNYLNPEQPLTVGELVQLVKADYLAQEVEKKDLYSSDDLSLSSVKLEDAPSAEEPAEEKTEGPADQKTEGTATVEEQNWGEDFFYLQLSPTRTFNLHMKQ